MTDTLRNQATTGMRWTAGAHGARQIVQLATLVALTRLLAPDDFGLMSMTMVFIGFAQIFHELGTGSVIIQRPDMSRRLLSTLFWLNVGCGASLFLVSVAAAPLVAEFYGDTRLRGLLPVVALTFLVTAPGVVPKALLRRRLRFRTLARIDMIAVSCGAVAAVVAALYGANAAALAVQAVVIHGIATVCTFIAGRWRPRLCWSFSELRSVFGYTASLTGYNIANHVMRHADYLIIGKLAGAEALGYYTIAYQLMLYPLRHVTAVVMRVAYPVYARLRDDHRRLRQAFCRTSANIATITFPLMTGVAVLAGPFVRTAFGATWDPAAAAVVLLAPVGLAQSLLATFGSIFQVVGRTGLFFLWSLLVGVCCIVGFLIGVRWEAIGVAAAYLIVTVVLSWPAMLVAFGLIDLPVGRFLAALRQPAGCAALMGLVVVAARATIGRHLTDVQTLGLCVPLGALSYAALSWAWNRRSLSDLLEVVLPRLRVRPG